MKKALLGTTALVASGLLVGAASAADIVPAPIPEPVEIEEGFTLSIEADANAGIWFGETDECSGDVRTTAGDPAIEAAVDAARAAAGLAAADVRDAIFQTSCAFNGSVQGTDQFHGDDGPTLFYEHKVVFVLESTLASGLYVAAIMETEKAGGDDWKDSWIVLEGNFGSMEIGFTDGAYKNSLTGGLDSGIYAEADGPKPSPFNEVATSDGSLDSGQGDFLIAYYTPRVHGFQAGVSYAPDSDDNEEFSDSQVHRFDSDDGWVDNWQVGLSWEGTIHENWEFEIGGGFGGGEAETEIDDFTKCQGPLDPADQDDKIADVFGSLTGDFECGDYDVWGVGGVVGNGHLTFGAMYTEIDFDQGFERTHWEAGTVVSFGDSNVGVHYGDEEDEHFIGGFTDDRQLVAVGYDKEIGKDFVWGVYGVWANQHLAWEKAAGVGDRDAWVIGTGWKIN